MRLHGRHISEYVMEERIGAGAFGEVWRARHHVWSDRLVAIKIPTHPQYIRNLQHEGTAGHDLSHPGIVAILGMDPYADPPYLVMEYVPGTSLRPWIESRSLSISDALTILRQVLDALGTAHAQGVLHLDIKPENILIHEQARDRGFGVRGMMKIVDFGLGRITSKLTEQSIVMSVSMNRGQDQRIVGTIDYMAPEQKAGDPVDARADLYSCGVVLYEMLTGQKPVGMEPPSELNLGVPRYIDDVFRRAYARLDKRFRSAQEFGAALVEPKPLCEDGHGRTAAPEGDKPLCRMPHRDSGKVFDPDMVDDDAGSVLDVPDDEGNLLDFPEDDDERPASALPNGPPIRNGESRHVENASQRHPTESLSSERNYAIRRPKICPESLSEESKRGNLLPLIGAIIGGAIGLWWGWHKETWDATGTCASIGMLLGAFVFRLFCPTDGRR